MSSLLLCIDADHLSPWALCAHVALREKGLPFELRTLNLDAGEQHADDYRDASVTGRVPALCVDGRFWLAESTAIVEYLEERFAPPQYAALLPRDLEQRARARQVQAWIRSDLLALRKERSTEVVFRGARGAALSRDAQQAADKLVSAATRLLAHGGKFLFGDWCIADVDLAVMLQRLLQHGDALPAPLRAYAEAQWQRPSVAEWVRQPR
ncbi:glutathione transferase [Ideonella sp. BN130291]|uniref:glutathione transferase n=1 Tax=Ideonella sp. BN130291 TaxID=3112940 RepID=UPI002E25ACE0|nr:glutathione transferase [Ideonella sp. BN130291]